MTARDAAADRLMTFGHCRFNAHTGQLWRNRCEAKLTPRSAAVLSLLVEHAGQVVTKQMFSDKVWDGLAVSDDALTSCIHELRHALGDDARKPHYIETRHRRGYRLKMPVVTEPQAGPSPTGQRPVGGDIIAPTSTVPTADVPLVLPDKPSLAVLPFQNMSGDPEQEYFVDGLVEDIITALSRTKALFVIARDSSFSYKGKSPDVRQVGRQLGVRYVLEGSVRKAGTKVRITGQVVDAQSGVHIWAERFDGDLADIFALQDEIASRSVIAIVPNLERTEIERRSSVPTGNLPAYDCSLRGWACIGQHTREATDEALSYFQRAMELDPNFALAWAQAGICYVQRRAWRWATDPEREAKEAERLARKALDLDRNDPRVLVLSGFVWEYLAGSPQEALPLFEKATELDPNHFFAWHRRGFACLRLGKPAIPYFERALRLNPRDLRAPFTQNALANAYLHTGDFAKAAELAEDALRHQPGYPPSLLTLIAARAHAGQLHEARAAVKTLFGLRPDASISNMVVDDNFPTYRQMMTEGCRLAGLPE